MAEPIFESPVTTTYPQGGGALALSDQSSTHKTLVRADTDSAAAEALGVAFGQSRRDGALVCGTRPGEWLLLGSAEECAAISDALDTSGHVTVVNFTHGRALFRLTGADAARAMEKVSNLDWSDPMTPDGAVVSGSVAKTGADIIRDDVDGVRSYLLACDRSFGQYLFDALLDAGDEFGIGVA